MDATRANNSSSLSSLLYVHLPTPKPKLHDLPFLCADKQLWAHVSVSSSYFCMISELPISHTALTSKSHRVRDTAHKFPQYLIKSGLSKTIHGRNGGRVNDAVQNQQKGCCFAHSCFPA